jgi:hypothetical protein
LLQIALPLFVFWQLKPHVPQFL